MSRRWQEVARASAGESYAEEYAERFRRLAAEGADVHGEASFVARLRPAAPGRTTRVLDAGCGTGRVAVRLAELGYDVAGCDVDAAMVEVAREEAPALDWRVADLATLDLGERYDVVLLAGNVVPLLEDGTLEATCVRLAAHVAPDGVLVAGFGTDADHLPDGCPVTGLDEFLAAAAAAGLGELQRWGTWAGETWRADDGYVVAVLGPAPDLVR
ncbi:class I SAM-dependent methyltransferase [Nocardioides rubriscoriae]|uniref:class I SAM-dependent methyltransferase n=1 Tax=Nocardioides rubriscoriae TaxID=642762 RepID=UPI0011DF28F0|nr:class I SAM-dependent methyltransferase [Nocardioides rubriscoriae]